MTTEKQRAANRRNASKCTGPKTDEGKAVVRLNALQHGLLSGQAFLPNEDEAALADFGQRLRAQFKPEGDLEELLVDRIISCAWRLRRLLRVESGIFTRDYFRIIESRGRETVRRAAKWSPKLEALDDPIERLGSTGRFPTKNELVIMDEEACARGLQQIKEASENTETDAATLGLAYAQSQDLFSKLSRYEIAIERSLYKALHELQRLQAARTGEDVPPSVIVEVNADPTAAGEQANREPGADATADGPVRSEQ